jgi:hypothetical protein
VLGDGFAVRRGGQSEGGEEEQREQEFHGEDWAP